MRLLFFFLAFGDMGLLLPSTQVGSDKIVLFFGFRQSLA
jgi:hypothetical protein